MTPGLIYGFDIATRCTGWCVGTGEVKPTLGSFKYAHVGDDLGLLGEMFERDLNALAERFGDPTVICYETPLLLPSDRLLPLRKAYGMGMQLERWARKRGAETCEIGAKLIKKRLTGDSSAKKDVMVDMVQRRLAIQLPAGKEREDMADAFGCWLAAGVDHHAKPFQPRWDALLYSGRGLLL